MEVSITALAIICAACFLAGVMNASGGSGGLISLPAFLLAGLPPHVALGCNKLQAVFGLGAAEARFIKDGYLNFHLAVPSVIAGMMGAFIGSSLTLMVSSEVLMYLMVFILPICAFFVLKKNVFPDDRPDVINLNASTYAKVSVFAFLMGIYDGFYGVGSSTFTLVAMTGLCSLSVRNGGAHAKAINLCNNIAALGVFLVNGQVNIVYGLAGGICGMIGAWFGAGAVIKNGAAFMRPAVIIAFILLLAKLVISF